MKKELGIDPIVAATWFGSTNYGGYTHVVVTCSNLATTLGKAVRRCYIDDREVTRFVKENGVPRQTVINAKLPDPGATMAGEFGEILTFVYVHAADPSKNLRGARKWRLKEDRNKSALKSDVLHVYFPNWPNPSAQDEVICSEVKTKSTASGGNPVASAIDDSAKDCKTRLAATLMWMKDRALTGSSAGLTVKELERVIFAYRSHACTKRFNAVAVVCDSVLPNLQPYLAKVSASHCDVLVIEVSGLLKQYQDVYLNALK